MDCVLVVEDSPEIGKLMELTLRMEGYVVLRASGGATAIDLAREHHPDLILLDVMMPGMTGFEVAQILKKDEQTSDIPIIFVTAKHEMASLVQGLEVGVDYIFKPFAVPELAARVKAAMRMRRLQEDLKASNEQLSKLAVTDSLTGLLNRRGFDAQIEDELWRARRFGHSLGFALFDLDRFKTVNDTWGHPQGDVVLQRFAEVLPACSRRVDKVARFGGEEFALLLPATDENGVNVVCEKVRSVTEDLTIPLLSQDENAPTVRITVSGGAVILPKISDSGLDMSHVAAGLFEMADRCLYQAKQDGRNRIVTHIISDEEAAEVGAALSPALSPAPHPAAAE